MPLIFQDIKDIKKSTQIIVQNELQGSNPFLRFGFLYSIITAISFRVGDFFDNLRFLLKQVFWDTATGVYLQRAASWFGITLNGATQSIGKVIAYTTFSTGETISSGEKLTINGLLYTVQDNVDITAKAENIESITCSGFTATATFYNDIDSLADNVSVAISGVTNETAYNGTFPITVIDSKTISYIVTELDLAPAIGTTITGDWSTAIIDVVSDGYGEQYNQEAGLGLTFQTAHGAVYSIAYVAPDGLTGGVDIENDDSLQIRFLSRVQNPVANFNIGSITDKIYSIAGNTRPKVLSTTPSAGYVTVYFTRDAFGIIPSAGDVTRTKDAILEIKPAQLPDDNVIIEAPTAKPIDFIFTYLSPNTATMQTAITESLDAMFIDKLEIGQDLSSDTYRGQILNTISVPGERIIDFTLGNPTGNQSAAPDEVLILGTLTFPPII